MGSFNAQGVANTLWAYATMGRAPGAGVMRLLEGRAEAVVLILLLFLKEKFQWSFLFDKTFEKHKNPERK